MSNPAPVNGKQLITHQQLLKVCNGMTLLRATDIALLINEICPKYKIDTPDRLHEFIAQVAHESGEFARKVENLNYSADRLVQVFPKYFNSESAKRCERNPQMIANMVYSNRMSNGDYKSGEGWQYRGGGFIQITGKDMYAKYAKYIGKDVKITAELVRENDWFALDSAAWVFAIEKQLLDEADADDMLTITKRINGGTNGLNDRMHYYERAKKFIS